MTAKYIVIEGVDGMGKSTQADRLTEHLRSMGYKVLHTKEPGSPHAPLTLELRGIMLDNKHDTSLTVSARELISQAIRSVHLEHVIVPALSEYNYIVQDRGILSGFAYGQACGNPQSWLEDLASRVVRSAFKVSSLYECSVRELYDEVILLTGNIEEGISRAKRKQEFIAGDVIEAKGTVFMKKVADNMLRYSKMFPTRNISIDGKTEDEVFDDIVSVLGLRKE